MISNRADVYLAVKIPDAAKVEELFKQHRIEYSDDETFGPFGSDGSLFVFFFSEVKHANMERETALLMEHSIPFSLFHEEGSDFYYGWSHGRLTPEGTMTYTQYFGDGENVSISEIQMLLDQSESLDQARTAIRDLCQKQRYPDW